VRREKKGEKSFVSQEGEKGGERRRVGIRE